MHGSVLGKRKGPSKGRRERLLRFRGRRATLFEVKDEEDCKAIWDELDLEATQKADPTMTQERIGALSISSGAKLHFKCMKHKTCLEHVWSTTLAARVYSGSGCPYCARRCRSSRSCGCILDEPGLLRIKYPDVFAEIDMDATLAMDRQLTRSMIMNLLSGSGALVWFKCKAHMTCDDHRWVSRVNTRQTCGCPYCARIEYRTCACPGSGRLAVDRPDIFKELDVDKMKSLDASFDPDVIGRLRISSTHICWWKCAEHLTCDLHRWPSPVGGRTRGKGCPVCAHRSCPCVGSHLLRIARPDLFRSIDQEQTLERFPTLRLDELLRASNQSVDWLCATCEYEWRSSVRDRAQLVVIAYKTGWVTSGLD